MKQEQTITPDDLCPKCGKEMSEAFGSHRLFCQKCEGSGGYIGKPQPSREVFTREDMYECWVQSILRRKFNSPQRPEFEKWLKEYQKHNIHF